MSEPLHPVVDRMLKAAGLGPVMRLVPLTGGANNRVYRVESYAGGAILKMYFRHPDDCRDRLGAEWSFSRFAWALGLRSIPRPIAFAPDEGYALFEFVDGSPVTECGRDKETILQAIRFVRDLNAARLHPFAAKLGNASEACFSIAEHLGTIEKRVDRLVSQSDATVRSFVLGELLPAWREVKAGVIEGLRGNRLSLDRILDFPDRCVSPSDFGFHNALREADGRLRFLDFEYAGWDDPAKLICDFFCQPSVPVPLDHFSSFTNEVAACFRNQESITTRTRLLFPLYRLKWVCIRMNEFLNTGKARREFALTAHELNSRRTKQLNAAKVALNALLSDGGVIA